MSDSPLGSFLLADGYRRPPVIALARERRLGRESARYAVSRLGELGHAPDESQGQGDPVLLVPGFLAGDYTLLAMARTLRRHGWRTYRSSIHVNVGCTLDAAALVESRLERIAERRGSRVQIVGHSLGGMLARGVAVRRPDLVSGIVTMGSPMMAPGAHHLSLTLSVAGLVALNRAGVPGVMSEGCVAGACARESFDESRLPMPDDVGFTAIYSKRDGIVDWRACIDPQATPVEVRTSHIGMAVDPRVSCQVLAALHRNQVAASAPLAWHATTA
ncbi:esterase/lipase family protein [Nocardioides acrostichi]|uniref:Alpha/beta hydrolase n=1 Tax=Nocardioides acrostichi TaxID=2784339 RepID=A0A930V4C0_9ACTN|nr:alpha/beta fold hydrolase [Nocardioides acrostichi]MBF4163592.1 alpha/beta hydrolase [Nocardioides acrostichi]